MSNHSLLKLSALLTTLMLLSTTVSAQQDISIQEYNENHPGFELAFSASLLPLSGSSDLKGWVGLDGQSDHGLGFSLGGIFYQRIKENDDMFYDFGIALGYTKMGEINPTQDDVDEYFGLVGYEIGVALRNPLWGVQNRAYVQSISLFAISPSFAQFEETQVTEGSTIGTGFGLKARVGYQKPVSEQQAFTFFVEAQYTQEISSINTNFYTLGAGVQFNLLFKN